MITSLQEKKNIPPKLLLLDVYETILDMSEIEKRVNYVLGSKRGYVIWFELFMQYSFVDNSMNQFHDFQAIGQATLQMASQLLKSNISQEEMEGILELTKHLPLKEGVQKGLSSLRDQDFRLAALTNSPEQIVTTRMERTGLISYFEKVLSAESVKKYKPAVEVYRWAAESLELEPGEILLVSVHGWDLAGAANAGMRTAYVKQSHQMLYPLAPEPEIICKDLYELTQKLLLTKKGGKE